MVIEPEMRRPRHHAPAELRFRADRHWVRRCRHWAEDSARAQGASTDAAEVVALLTSELVTNAVKYGPDHGEVSVRLHTGDGELGVEVSDGCPQPPAVRDPGPTATGGRGVQLVDVLASRWGVRRRPPGKSVWFVVPLGGPSVALAG